MVAKYISEEATAGAVASTVLSFTAANVDRVLIQSDGSARTSWTIDGTDPVLPIGDAAGRNGALLSANAGGHVHDVLSLDGVYDPGGVVVKVISDGTPAVIVRAEY